MDALSSMANIAGYRAVVEAASFYGRFFTGQMTAAGRVPPAKVLVIGAGVAGLAAIGAARGMGAIVRAFDTRPTVKEQVKSMGAEFIELNVAEDGEGAGGYAKEMSPAFIKAEMDMFVAQAKDVDIIITTALIPNRPAPILITEEMVKAMKKGSVIVDLAAENGGNCALTEPGNVVERYGVHILGYTDLPSRLAPTASLLFGNNLTHLLADLGGASHFHLDLADEVVRGALVLRNGELLWPPPRAATGGAAAGSEDRRVAKAVPVPHQKHDAEERRRCRTGVRPRWPRPALIGLGLVAPPAFLSHLTVFALACIVGWQVVWNVTPALHTPLMSVTNAISGIIVIGGMLQVSGPPSSADRDARRRRHPAGLDQHRRRLSRDAADVEDVPPMTPIPETLVTIAYLVAGLLFIFSLGGLSAQESARRGNVFGMTGMLIAVLVTTFGPRVDSYTVLTVALVAGGAIGAALASRASR